jgi:GNAT superfamily N-acetyltransferase
LTVSDLNVYLTSLVGSWDALASSHGDARVIRGQGFVAALFDSQPVFDNALLLEADDYDELRGCYPEGRWYATWTLADDTAARLRAAGQRLDTTTTAMVLQLDGLVEDATRAPLVRRVHPSLVAELNGLPADVLADVPGARAYATEDEAAGLVLIEVGTDVNASFVATRPEARRRGLATAALREAVLEARSDGFTTSSLQSTSAGLGVYSRLGYRPVGTWQEWVPAAEAGRGG